MHHKAHRLSRIPGRKSRACDARYPQKAVRQTRLRRIPWTWYAATAAPQYRWPATIVSLSRSVPAHGFTPRSAVAVVLYESERLMFILIAKGSSNKSLRTDCLFGGSNRRSSRQTIEIYTSLEQYAVLPRQLRRSTVNVGLPPQPKTELTGCFTDVLVDF